MSVINTTSPEPQRWTMTSNRYRLYGHASADGDGTLVEQFSDKTQALRFANRLLEGKRYARCTIRDSLPVKDEPREWTIRPDELHAS